MFRRTIFNSGKNIFRSFSTRPSMKFNNNNNNNNNEEMLKYMIGITALTATTLMISSNTSDKRIINETISNIKKEQESIENIVIVDDKFAFVKKNFDDKIYRVNIPNVEYLEKKINSNDIPVEFVRSQNWTDTIVTITSILLMMAIFFSITRNMTGVTKLMEIEKSGVVMKNINVKFEDIIGQKNAKQSVIFFITTPLFSISI